MASATPKGPYKLVTVNNVPERAKRLIGRVVAELADQITIVHAANCASKHPLYSLAFYALRDRRLT